MSLIKVDHLTFSYPASLTPVFRDVSFKLDTNWRLGLIGRGKTTFLHLLAGDYPFTGTISSHADCVYFPQRPADPSLFVRDVLAELYPLGEDWQLRRELNLLGCDADEILWRPFDTLSGGEQTKMLLAGLFLDDAAFPLIDEPTNHLDLAGREAVARYLSRKPGFILVSHDRRFLDAAVDHILAINASDIEVHSGNYSSWQDNFARRERAIEEKSKLLKDFEHEQPLKLVPLTYRADRLVTFEEVQVRYAGVAVGAPRSFTIHRGDRLFLDGPNGSGKSSLLRLLAGEPLDHSGRVLIASGLIISYVAQRTDALRGSVFDFAEAAQIDRTLFLSFLRKMGFPRDHFDRDMTTFSEGQKKKVLLAKSLSEQAHLYVWDEPLNYIDLASRLQIETLIKTYQPTMLLVEHDRAFRDAIATEVVTL